MSNIHTHPRALYQMASMPALSKEAKRRLKWMDYYRVHRNVAKTCRYFGIARKTFYSWQKRYDPYHLESLEEKSRRPKHTRIWEVRRKEEFRIIALRKAHIRYGKEKLKILYHTTHGEHISSWKIQRVIEKHQLYYRPARTVKLRKKRMRNQPKKRITELKKEHRKGFLIACDTVVRYWNGSKRYIITGIDVHSKIAFARMYSTKHARHAEDFLRRMHYLLEGCIENITRDNGSEFAGVFDEAVRLLELGNYFSRVRTPTDNPVDERFNRTIQEEFIELGNMTADCAIFNKRLTDWLIEYNFNRPHQALGYATPIAFHYQHHKVLPMYPASTLT